MSWKHTLCLAACVAFTFWSCAEDKSTPEPVLDTTTPDATPQDLAPPPPPPDVPTPVPDTAPVPEVPTSVPGELGSGQPVELLPPPPKPAPRARRRVNLDQLQASILKATGGITATHITGQAFFEFYAASLGRPDFETSVEEELSPGLLFDKLMGDAARAICPSLMTSEQAAAPEERVFIKHAALDDTVATAPDNIAKNMQMLVLRFHGRYLAPDSPELEPWMSLLDAVTTESEEADPITGWSAICTALLTHPDFVSY
jgi:hypothetical protein